LAYSIRAEGAGAADVTPPDALVGAAVVNAAINVSNLGQRKIGKVRIKPAVWPSRKRVGFNEHLSKSLVYHSDRNTILPQYDCVMLKCDAGRILGSKDLLGRALSDQEGASCRSQRLDGATKRDVGASERLADFGSEVGRKVPVERIGDHNAVSGELDASELRLGLRIGVQGIEALTIQELGLGVPGADGSDAPAANSALATPSFKYFGY
jgi:hypothetical protein